MYTQLMIDEHTHMYFVWHMKRKHDVYGVIEEATAVLEREAKRSVQGEFRRIKIEAWRTDGDGMFRSTELKELLLWLEQHHHRSAPHKHNNATFIERGIRTVNKVA